VQGHGSEVLRLLQQYAPTHGRRAQPQTEKAQRRFTQDHAWNRQRQVHDQIAHEGGQHVAEDDAVLVDAHDLGRHHEVLFPQLQKAPAHHARQVRPALKRQNDGDAEVNLEHRPVGRKRRAQRHPQRNGGNGDQKLGHALDQVIYLAAKITRDAAQDGAQDEAQRHAYQTHRQRDRRP